MVLCIHSNLQFFAQHCIRILTVTLCFPHYTILPNLTAHSALLHSTTLPNTPLHYILHFTPYAQLSSDRLDHWICPLYAILVMVWACFMLAFWRQKASALAHRWGVLDYEVSILCCVCVCMCWWVGSVCCMCACVQVCACEVVCV